MGPGVSAVGAEIDGVSLEEVLVFISVLRRLELKLEQEAN